MQTGNTTMLFPFRGLRPASGRASDVIAPPYDVITSDEARERATGKAWSFLHVSKPEIDLPVGTDPYAPAVYQAGAVNLTRMVHEHVLVRDSRPCYYVYRMEAGDHVQTGVAAVGSLIDYASNRIRRHELTTPEKEDDRVCQINVLNAQTGPVLSAYPESPAVDVVLAEASHRIADADAVDNEGVRHSLWVVEDRDIVDRLSEALNALPCIYIADGHHRSAAAARVAALRRPTGAPIGLDASYEYFLNIVFPVREMRILEYNRLVADLGGFDANTLLRGIEERFQVTATARPVRPAQAGEFGLFVAGKWYRLTIDPAFVPASDPLARLDVRLLADQLLQPLLGITDDGHDTRLAYVGGSRGLQELERRVASGEMAAAVSLFPTQMADVMAVADAGKVMPPKSTWFAPKLVDGLISHVLD